MHAAHLLDRADVVFHELNRLGHEEQLQFLNGGNWSGLRARLGALADKAFGGEVVKTIRGHRAQIVDYCLVRQSFEDARAFLICLLRQEASLKDCDTEIDENNAISVGRFQIDQKRWALQIAKTTGSIQDIIVRYAISEANEKADVEFFKKLGRSLARKQRPAEIDYSRVGIVPRFLVDKWCGEKGHYGMWIRLLPSMHFGHWKRDGGFAWHKAPEVAFLPPLCFLTNKALSDVCALALKPKAKTKELAPGNIRKWISRLKLRRATSPRILEVKAASDGIVFVTQD
ncbi:MAG TPA: hypothetical protein VFA90_17315 [Terriglobales bacterium]|nr:hypothetical protein [Terriglobales bacterium]